MPTKRIRAGGTTFIVTEQSCWKPGDMPPAEKSDYLGWHAWAEVQHKAGLRQRQCGCGRWFYPQELSGKERVTTMYRDKYSTARPVKVVTPICKGCDAPPGDGDQ